MALFLFVIFLSAALVNVSFCASTNLTTSIDDCISRASVQLATDDLADWIKNTTHTKEPENREGSIWKLENNNHCAGSSTCINLSGAWAGSGWSGKHVWIEQTVNVSMVKGLDIRIGIHGFTSNLNDIGEHAWVIIGCDGQMDAEFAFHEGNTACAEFVTCSIIENSNCNALTVRIGGELGAYGDDIYVKEVYLQYVVTEAPTAITTTPTASPTTPPSTFVPTQDPTAFSLHPTITPTSSPTTEAPTSVPTHNPTTLSFHPTSPPTTDAPTFNPTISPTTNPTRERAEAEVVENTPTQTQNVEITLAPKQSKNNVFLTMALSIAAAFLFCLILSVIGLRYIFKHKVQYKRSVEEESVQKQTTGMDGITVVYNTEGTMSGAKMGIEHGTRTPSANGDIQDEQNMTKGNAADGIGDDEFVIEGDDEINDIRTIQ
eukprot:754449_1